MVFKHNLSVNFLYTIEYKHIFIDESTKIITDLIVWAINETLASFVITY